MANDNFYPGQVPGQPLGTGEGESPLAKPTVPNMDVRTMDSDLRSVNTGNSAPKPYAPQAVAPDNIPVAPISTPAPFTPDQSFQAPQADTNAIPSGEPTPKKGGKTIFTVIIAAIVVIGLAALGYFVIYPIFFAAPAETVPALVENPNPIPTPTPEPTPIPENIPTPPATVTAPAHISLFTIQSDSQFETSVITTGATLANVVLSTTAAPAISEVTYKDSNGNLMKFSDIFKTATGLDISTNQTLGAAFNDLTATGLIYTDSNNSRWLGFTAQLASGADVASVSAAFKQILESTTDYSGLFASAPGTAQTWRDGQVAGATGVRYLLFSDSGFAIDYGWVGNKLVVVTSYNGFKETVRRVQ